MFNPFEMMKKAQQMQEKMQSLQQQMGRRTVEAEAGGGLVTAVVNGRMELVKVKIDKTRFNPADLELLEDVITSAVAAAQAKAAGMMQEAMAKMAADAGLPAGLLSGGGMMGE